MAKKKITIEGLQISIEERSGKDYISLTDLAKNSSDEP